MTNSVQQICVPQERKVEAIITSRARLVLEVFLAGTGLMLWVSGVIFSPINEVKTDIKLIQQDINTIQLNHEQHIQEMVAEIADVKKTEADLDARLETQNEAIIELLTLAGKK
jgi:hypothetical protein